MQRRIGVVALLDDGPELKYGICANKQVGFNETGWFRIKRGLPKCRDAQGPPVGWLLVVLVNARVFLGVSALSQETGPYAQLRAEIHLSISGNTLLLRWNFSLALHSEVASLVSAKMLTAVLHGADSTSLPYSASPSWVAEADQAGQLFHGGCCGDISAT